jgi:hypothetical protein
VRFGMRKTDLRGISLVRNFKELLTSFFAVIFLFASAAAWQSSEDCVLSGTVTYFGDSNASGLSVEAFIGDLKVASCQSQDGRYQLTIRPDDPATPSVREGYVEGDPVVIKVNGYKAGDFEASGGIHSRDLFVSASDVSNLTTWGKIKALFR